MSLHDLTAMGGKLVDGFEFGGVNFWKNVDDASSASQFQLGLIVEILVSGEDARDN